MIYITLQCRITELLIGSPGVGKTYILKELRRSTFNSEDIPHLLLPIDQLGDGNPEEWPDGFSFQWQFNRYSQIHSYFR